MSTKTNFKRIALVAVAALGMGVLSSVPSQAAVNGLTISATAGSTTRGTSLDTATAAVISVEGLANLGNGDTITVTFVQRGTLPAAAVARMAFLDTKTATNPGNNPALTVTTGAAAANSVTAAEAVTTTLAVSDSTTAGGLGFAVRHIGAAGQMSARFAVQLESTTASRGTTGTYTYTAIATPYSAGVAGAAVTANFDIVIAALASESTVIAPGSSTAFLGTAIAATSDAVISALATASSTPAAYVRVVTKNANGDAKPESITATISGAGLLSFGGISGSSLTVAGTGSSDISVLPNGVAGTATITISTTSRTFPAKTMTFYAAAPTTLVASVATPLAAIGDQSDVVRVVAKDSAGVSWAGALYIYASTAADALIAGSLTTPVLCRWDAADDRHECNVSGLSAGTAKFKTINASTVAAATVTSNEVSVVVSQASAATVKIEFDKASYAPGERARIYVTPLDSTGKAIQATAFSNLLATGGISTASALTFAGSTTTADSLTAVAITTKGNSSSTSGARAGSMEYTVYMPVSGGTVTLSATGGSSLPIAGRVAVTATATVTDSGAAALAAVTALATTVASLKTLITTLTNLVLKIQKKVKA
jgi:hypothetical protein